MRYDIVLRNRGKKWPPLFLVTAVLFVPRYPEFWNDQLLAATKNREAWIITMADKICASMEYCHIYIALERGRRVVVAANS